jgi:hypothetical protein
MPQVCTTHSGYSVVHQHCSTDHFYCCHWLYTLALLNVVFHSTDDFYEKVVCGGERPRLGPAPPAPLRALLRRCWSLQSDSRPSMPVILGHLAFITAEAEREKGGVAAGGAYYGEVSVCVLQ